jgi:L-lactate dehydrogenase complex protein LldG
MHSVSAGPTPARLWETFARKATAVSASVHRAASVGAALDLLRAEVTGGAFVATASLHERWPALATAADGEAQRNTPTPEVVAAGRLAVAETGSVLVRETNPDRGACYLAERLWLVVDAADVVPTLDQAFARVQEAVGSGAPYLTFMTGPSRTADIERTLTVGVHGPRALAILVIGEDGRP